MKRAHRYLYHKQKARKYFTPTDENAAVCRSLNFWNAEWKSDILCALLWLLAASQNSVLWSSVRTSSPAT